MWFASQEDELDDDDEDTSMDADPALAEPASHGGGRTLGGAPAPATSASTSSQAAKKGQAKSGSSKLRTLKDLQGDSGAHAHGDGDDSDNDQDFFAGGEKSGLAVQNPNNPRDKINSILERARK